MVLPCLTRRISLANGGGQPGPRPMTFTYQGVAEFPLPPSSRWRFSIRERQIQEGNSGSSNRRRTHAAVHPPRFDTGSIVSGIAESDRHLTASRVCRARRHFWLANWKLIRRARGFRLVADCDCNRNRLHTGVEPGKVLVVNGIWNAADYAGNFFAAKARQR